MTHSLIPRHLHPQLDIAMGDTPAVLINGPRQCGKTTLVRLYADRMAYFSLDDPALLAAVRADPLGFVRRQDRLIIDEVQRAPELLLALKLAIDQDRRPGRFLLTGSANLMALPAVADSLAGRVEIHTLLPLSNAEIAERPADFVERLLRGDWPPAAPGEKREDIVGHVLAGGYPEMRQRATPARRQAWTRAYLTTLVERDVRDVADIAQTTKIPQLLGILARLSGQLLSLQQIGGQIGLDGKTVEKYIGILEKMYLVRRLPAWSGNELSRLIKTPKLHFFDAGLQASLARLTPERAWLERTRFGATLETWVHGELLKTLALGQEPWFLFHYRDKDQVEVDFVLESPLGEMVGIEVKASATVTPADFKGLRRLAATCPHRFRAGAVLYDGEHVLSFGDGMYAVPLRRL
ncbi:ATP-binding protein [Sulfuritalea sp.]|uniref:ATP-binding protein n=1 Tax=Sulfuritalea sp. TaxID=2480090 RepID=UPI001ACD145B|nr:ATP-binding protein [Sulfuritalea sp.]MBN8476655.1 ATP-binding protein [Sulfuritalea sp.]